jgi:hypothetical protein
MEQSPQEYKNLPLMPVLRQMNSVHILVTNFFNILF